MIRKFKENVSKLKAMITFKNEESDELKLKIGKLNSNLNDLKKDYINLTDYEFSVFSQFGDDGIIQYLINKINIPFKTFIEFGVEDYLESNTRFLMMNDNWEGFVMDGSTDAINSLKSQIWFWKRDFSISKSPMALHLNGTARFPYCEMARQLISNSMIKAIFFVRPVARKIDNNTITPIRSATPIRTI